MEAKIELLNWQGIFRVIVVGLIILIIWKTRLPLTLMLVSAMLATALYPMVNRISRFMPMQIAAFLVILLLLVPFIFLIAAVVPSFIRELPGLSQTIDTLLNSSSLIPPALRSIDFTQYVQNGVAYVLQSTSVVTNTVTSIISILVLTYYFTIDAHKLIAIFLSFFPKDKQANIAELLTELAKVNGHYIRGNLLISIICGIVIFAGLAILQVPFAAPLAIFAAVLDLLPLIGSTIGAIPAVIIAFSVSPLAGILIICLFLAYQQVENAVISPLIYNRALNISAALSFIAVIIGSALFGLVGAFLALPIAASIPTLIKYIKEEELWQFA